MSVRARSRNSFRSSCFSPARSTGRRTTPSHRSSSCPTRTSC